MIRIRRAEVTDAPAWARMRQLLWPDSSGGHIREIASYFRGELSLPLEVLLAIDDTRGTRVVGFAELSIRPYAEGCTTSRVAFLEGWYVEPEYRRRGIGAALVRASEEWGRAKGCTEFGSDADLDNTASHSAHRALGFTEVVRIVSFRKDL